MAEQPLLSPAERATLEEFVRRVGSQEPSVLRPETGQFTTPERAAAELTHKREQQQKAAKAVGVAAALGTATAFGGPAAGARLGLSAGAITALTGGLDVAGQAAAEWINQQLGYTEKSPEGYILAMAGPAAGRVLGLAGHITQRYGPLSRAGRETLGADKLRNLADNILRPLPKEDVAALYAGARQAAERAQPEAFGALGREQAQAFRPQTLRREIPRWLETEEPTGRITGMEERQVPRWQETGEPIRRVTGMTERQIPRWQETGQLEATPTAGRTPGTPAELDLLATKPPRPNLGYAPRETLHPLPLKTVREITGAEEGRGLIPQPPRTVREIQAAEEGTTLEPLTPKVIPARRVTPSEGIPESELQFPPGAQGTWSRRLYRMGQEPMPTGEESSNLPQAFSLYQHLGLATRIGANAERKRAAGALWSAMDEEFKDIVNKQRPGWESVRDFLQAQQEYKRLRTTEELGGALAKRGVKTQDIGAEGGPNIVKTNIGSVLNMLEQPGKKLQFTKEMGEQLEPELWDKIHSQLQEIRGILPGRRVSPWVDRLIGGVIGAGLAGGTRGHFPAYGLGALAGAAVPAAAEWAGRTAPVIRATQRAWQQPLGQYPRTVLMTESGIPLIHLQPGEGEGEPLDLSR